MIKYGLGLPPHRYRTKKLTGAKLWDIIGHSKGSEKRDDSERDVQRIRI